MHATKEHESFVLDTSALLAFWNDEEGADEVEKILRSAPDRADIYYSFMTSMEAKYRLWRHGGRELAIEFDRMVGNLPLTRVDLTDSILNLAAEIKATKRISVADSWVIATALENGATLVHKDPEFEQVRDRLSLLPLPYKRKKIKQQTGRMQERRDEGGETPRA